MRKLGILLFVLMMSYGVSQAGSFYVGASVGDTSVKVDDSSGNFDASATSFKVFAGWNFMKFLGVEGSYLDFGSPKDTVGGTDVKIEPTGWDAFIVGKLPLGKRFDIFGKLGMVFWDTKTKVEGAGSDSDSGNDTVWGLGATWHIGDHLGIRGEYEVFDIQNTDDVTMWSVGAQWQFGK